MTSCKKSGPVQQMLNIIKNLDRKVFEPILVTLYEEDKELSQLHLFEPHVKHVLAPTGKKEIILGRDRTLRRVLAEIGPDVVHSLGVFPDYAVSRIKKYNQIITLRNYVYEDYLAKFGKLKGTILAKLHLYAMTHTKKTVACSESLSKIYKRELNMTYDFVRNGVDIDQYSRATEDEKMVIRKEMNLPLNSFIFVYTGQLIERKNMDFLLRTYIKTFKDMEYYLLVLGGGAKLDELKAKYGHIENIDFRGNVLNVNHYLKACDAYVSASKSEGLPNGVLEAMATGLPVILSDIPQHIEVYEANTDCGFIFDINSEDALAVCLRKMTEVDYKKMGAAAYDSAHMNFSSPLMSGKYQELYKELAGHTAIEGEAVRKLPINSPVTFS